MECIGVKNALDTVYKLSEVRKDNIKHFCLLCKRMIEENIAIREGRLKESEGYYENLIRDFLVSTFYNGEYSVNKLDRYKSKYDLVIKHKENKTENVKVIIEVKSPFNEVEMIHLNYGKQNKCNKQNLLPELFSGNSDNPNKDKSCPLSKKAFSELLYYFLNERIGANNLSLTALIITNFNEWYIFNAQDFEREFLGNKSLINEYKNFNSGNLSVYKTKGFYNETEPKYIEGFYKSSSVKVIKFTIDEIEEHINNDEILALYYKILSPITLLKERHGNDSNFLNTTFYNELLYIMGLEEHKEKDKVLIRRRNEKYNSLIGVLFFAFEFEEKFNYISKKDKDEQFDIALKLVIVWINRILFLKLLEGQLKLYKTNSTRLKNGFMNGNIKSLYELNLFFFNVLAVKEEDRPTYMDYKIKYGDIPYLNSSLFEHSYEEVKYNIDISSIGEPEIQVYSNTVLKDYKGNRFCGSMKLLDYIFSFLSCFNFTSYGTKQVVEDNKTLINASVLGLIFEKINGYKDGSVFTPGFITQYMAEEAIEKIVIDKFNLAYLTKYNDTKYTYKTLSEIRDRIGPSDRYDFNELEASSIFNDIHICDMAVGSGHFLVSALNILLYIKNLFGLLCTKELNLQRKRSIVIVWTRKKLLIYGVLLLLTMRSI